MEAGLKEVIPLHNQKLAQFFSVEKTQFLDSNNEIDPKHLFFCNDPVSLIEEVKKERNIIEETSNLLQGDTGQGWLKVGLSIIKMSDLEREPEGTRLQSGGYHFISKKSVSEQEDEDTA